MDDVNFPKDIPCALDQIERKLSDMIMQLKQMRSGCVNRDETVYYLRLHRFLCYTRKEVTYFMCHEDMNLLHTCKNEIN